MIPHLSHVMTLANSIIGVSVLAMPFCFKQCGIVLAILVLLTSSVLSRLACHFLIKSAVMSRRRNFEFLAFHAFGTTGKFLVELFIIGFLLGTCIAFFVVVGDLGPQIVGKILNKEPEDIRTSVLVTTGTFIVLPLGLLRNIDSLSSVCTATIGFYICLVIKVISESTRHIFLGDWYDRVMYWRPAGILQCLPIFSMALFCQTQLFEIYEAIPNVCLEKMNQVVRGALNICTAVYLCVGFFGYVAFCTQPFTGNILMSFEPSLTSDIIKMGFVFSVAFSFPLVIFPCRASLNSLLYRRAHTHEPTNNYIPEVRFRCLTLTIVTMALGTGILIPNIEFLLGIVGSTIGVMICLIFPAAFFIAISTKNTNERLIAQAILFFGMWIMVLGTYANIYAMDESSNARLLITTGKPLIDQINDTPFKNKLKEDFPLYQPVKEKPDPPDKKQQILEGNLETLDVRQEPPIPVERSIFTEKSPVETQNLGGNLADVSFRPMIEKTLSENTKSLEDGVRKNIVVQASDTKGHQSNDVENAKKKSVELPAEGSQSKKLKEEKEKKKNIKEVEQQKNENLIDSDAIKKEESELAAAAGEETTDNEAAARHDKLRQTLEKHKIEQLELMHEQEKLLERIKEQKEEYEKMEKKRLANEQIKNERITIDEKMRKNIIERNMTNERKILRKEQIASKLENILINNSTVKRDKVAETVTSKMVDSEESHGPILNALTNWTSKRNAEKEASIVVDEVSAGIKAAPNEKENIRKVVKEEKSIGIANLPIALQLRNKTNKLPIVEEKLPLADVNKSTKENLAIHRDILEQRELEKREKRETRDDDDTEISNFEVESIVDNVNTTAIEHEETADGKQCRRRRDDNFIERDETIKKTDNIETINIPITTGNEKISEKTNGFLANQRLNDKSLSSNYHNFTQVNLSKLKKRDLKALKGER